MQGAAFQLKVIRKTRNLMYFIYSPGLLHGEDGTFLPSHITALGMLFLALFLY